MIVTVKQENGYTFGKDGGTAKRSARDKKSCHIDTRMKHCSYLAMSYIILGSIIASSHHLKCMLTNGEKDLL